MAAARASRFWEPLLTSPPPNAHIAEVYQDEAFLAETVGMFIAEGLAQGESVVIVATGEHRRLFTEALAQRGVTPKEGRLLTADAAATLAEFHDGDRFDAEAFRRTVGGLIAAAAGPSGRPVRVYGEMVNLLWQAGETRAAAVLEGMWNELSRDASFTLLCAYHVDAGLPGHEDRLHDVCQAHTHLIPASPGALDPWLERKIWLKDAGA